MSNISKIINNNARFGSNKEINITNFVPSYLQNTDVKTFIEFFENYLNELYEGTGVYVDPNLLDNIDFTGSIFWTNDSLIVTARGSKFTEFFKIGDYLKKGTENVFYRINRVIDDETLELTDKFNITVDVGKKGYYDKFNTGQLENFWKPSTNASPFGNDGTVQTEYTLDVNNERIVNTGDVFDYSTITSGVEGDFELEFGLHLGEGTYRDNSFGVVLSTSDEDISGGYVQIISTSGVLDLSVSGTNIATFEPKSNVDDYTIYIKRDIVSSEMVFEVRNTTSESVSSTWSDSISGIPVVGYHNKWKKTYSTTILENQKKFAVSFKNGYKQGYNYVQFISDAGFRGLYDDTGTNILIDESSLVRVSPYGRLYDLDGTTLYGYYLDDDNNLRITNLIYNDFGSLYKSAITHISILEKIKRLLELHDPDLIDIEYINYFANYLGYKVGLSREDIELIVRQNVSNYDDLSLEEKEEIQNKYLRFIIRNLPTWYKIKTTESAVNILLYSFGLIAEIQNYFTTNYESLNTFFIEGISDNEITNNAYITPHFTVQTDLDESLSNFSLDESKMLRIRKAIESIKPINTVFHGINGWLKRQFDIYVYMYSTANLFIKVN